MSKKNSAVLLPFKGLWYLILFFLKLPLRLLIGILGFAFMSVGIILTLTIVGAPVGIPLAIAGFLLLLRSIF